jgi:hypothetical protein
MGNQPTKPFATWLGRVVPLEAPFNGYAVWFGRVVWVGVIGNLLLAVPGLLYPQGVLELVLGPYEQALYGPDALLWPRFAALLLILLSLFYVPAALNPFHYRASACLAVLSRFAGVLFFLPQGERYLLFGLYDLAFGLVQGALLVLAYRNEALDPGVRP